MKAPEVTNVNARKRIRQNTTRLPPVHNWRFLAPFRVLANNLLLNLFGDTGKLFTKCINPHCISQSKGCNDEG